MNFNQSTFEESGSEKIKKISPEDIKFEDFGVNINDFSEEAEEIEKLRKLRSDNNWKEVRSEEKFELVEKQFSFGVRKVYLPKDSNNNVDLQSSRGVGFSDGETLESTLRKYLANTENLDEPNFLRLQELEKINAHIKNEETFIKLLNSTEKEKEKNALRKAFIESGRNFVEIGFRVPSLLNFFKKSGYETLGYDINPLSISICKKLGWNVEFKDLNDLNSIFNINPGTLIVCYHVLEHLSNPLESLKNLSKQLPPGVKLHFEIPIEPGVPRLNFGHLFPFERGDLQKMLIEAGFITVSFSNATHPGGPEIERVLAISK
jgi:hypothetical protein